MIFRRKCLSRFRHNQQGSVAIIFALLIVTLFGVVAMAIDLARVHSLSSKMTSSLDAAALAGAKLLDGNPSDHDISTTAKAFFASHMATLRIHGVDLSSTRVNIDRDKSSVTVIVDANMKTMFGSIVGLNTLTLNRAATVVLKLRDVELAMAVDITGSMNVSNKLNDLKHAAKDVLDTMFKDAPSETAVRVALVPWSAAVNAGSLASTVSGNQSTDNCVVERKGSSAATEVLPFGADKLRVTDQVQNPSYSCSPNAVMPLFGKSKLSNLQAKIEGLSAMGGTAGHIGLAWGWYMLSPDWASILGASRPAPYDHTKTLKSVLLMTDGEFNVSHLNPGPSSATQINESYAQFQALCTAMKAKKVAVYTVGFGLTSGSRAETELKACAGASSNFFPASNGSELSKAFQAIAVQLTSLRVAN